MIILRNVQQWRAIQATIPSDVRLGLVPTMGALHEGHLSLVRASFRDNDSTIVSIFVNPVQFNNQQDLASYPASFDQDCRLLENEGVQYLFAPTYEVMYPDDYTYRVEETAFSKLLCGATRPGHFTGVLTVVLKLLSIFRAHRAYFGEKDYQQYRLVDGMAKAFFLKTEIVCCPIVREASNLAMSSRNRLLSPKGRATAPLLYKALSSGKSRNEIIAMLEDAGFQVDYVEELDGRLFAAVFLENVRLIDNVKR